jgi:hypothetical protein
VHNRAAQAVKAGVFANDLAINITDPNSPAAANVGYSAAHFPP